MNSEITGKIIVVGDNIDTDQIYPGCYLALTDPKEIGSHCLSGVDVNIAANFPQGGIVVAGRNFGCGSSREHAPIALLWAQRRSSQIPSPASSSAMRSIWALFRSSARASAKR